MSDLAFPRPIVFGRDYWLCRCEGFRVDCPNRRVGRVEEVRFGSRIDCPDWLVIRGGVLGQRRLIVTVADVEEVEPRQERIVLRKAPSGRNTHTRLTRLREATRQRSQLVEGGFGADSE